MTTELSIPKGHGLVRVAHNLREHVPAYLWQAVAGTDFWLVAQTVDLVTTAAAANPSGLSGWGWTTTNLTLGVGSAGDFLSSDGVGTPAGLIFGSDTDLLQSPPIFGDYLNGLLAGKILGRYPTKMIMEVYASFSTNSAEETRTGFGLVEAGGTAGTDDDAMVWIHDLGSTNVFSCRSAADSDNGSADNTDPHLFRVVISKGTTDAIEWFIDGVSQGTLDLQEDLWPCSFGAYSSTTNRLRLSFAHFWYE